MSLFHLICLQLTTSIKFINLNLHPFVKKKNPCNIYPKRSMPLGPRRKELKINTVSETGKVTDDISQREGRRGQSWDYQSG